MSKQDPWLVQLARKVEALKAEAKEQKFAIFSVHLDDEIAEKLLEAQDALLQTACWLQALKVGHFLGEYEELDFREDIELER